jgi:hypothetical protein
MAKSGKKRKRAEKSKTKLKQSIKLPKGLNETDTKFTSMKITLINQLRTNDAIEDIARVTKKKLGIRDLLSKLANNGTSTRFDGLDGLLELLKAHPALIGEHLSQLMLTVVSLTTDRESKIRTAARSVIKLILTQVSPDQIEPLNSSICAHLCCGLSHIDTDIQLDALKLLDVILETTPQLAKNNHELLLPNCLDQVSLKAKANSQMRSLTKDVDSKITALQWRTDVLTRVSSILALVYATKVNETDNIDSLKTCLFEDQYYMNLNVQCTSQPLSLAEITNGRSLAKKESSSVINNSMFNLNQFTSGLINILLDTWCEAVAMTSTGNDKQMASNGLINASILPTLEVVIKLLKICDNFADQRLLGHIIKNFPYDSHIVSNDTNKGKKTKNNATNNVSSALALNLDICHLWLTQDVDDDDVKEGQTKVIQFIAGKKVFAI